MWRTLLNEAPPGRHITQFYRDPKFLQQAISAWLGGGLAEGGGAVVLGTQEHWQWVQDALETDGFPVKAMQESEQVVFLEVHSFLDGFLASGRPDPAVFHREVGSAMEKVGRTCRDPTQIRAWGEAVEILRQRNDMESAHAIEQLWNGAIEERGFSLLCSYHVHNLDPETHQGPMGQLADTHSDVIPEQDYSRLNEAVDQALCELYGEEKASALWAKLWSRPVSASSMPTGQSLLAFFSRNHPKHASRLFECTRRNYEPVSAD